MKAKHFIRRMAGLAFVPVLFAAGPANAVEAGDWIIRAGVAHVAPNDDSTALDGAGAPANAKVSVGSATNIGINFTYMITNQWGVEVLGALPFAHDIDGDGSLSGVGTVIETDQLPPTVMAVYNFAPGANLRPYAGVGLNYTTFMNEKGVGALDGTDVSLDDSTGLAFEVGADYDINPDIFLNASLWYIDIETTAHTALGDTDVTIDPWVFFLGAGFRF